MKDLGRRRGDRALDVVLRGQRQEALEPRAGTFGPLALDAVAEEADEAAEAPPLLLGRAEELVDHHLRHVREVAELRLPDDERLRHVEGEAPVEAEDPCLRERAVPGLESRAASRDGPQRHMKSAGFEVVENRMP